MTSTWVLPLYWTLIAGLRIPEMTFRLTGKMVAREYIISSPFIQLTGIFRLASIYVCLIVCWILILEFASWVKQIWRSMDANKSWTVLQCVDTIWLDTVHQCTINDVTLSHVSFTKVCPKGLNPGLSISRLKLLTLKLHDLEKMVKDKEGVKQAIQKCISKLPPVTEA